MKPEKYTERFHARRVLLMLSSENPCTRCPARKDPRKSYSKQYVIPGLKSEIPLKDVHASVCRVCREFSGARLYCPCGELGSREAVRRAWVKLKEMGMI
jgi:hypothetical protein